MSAVRPFGDAALVLEAADPATARRLAVAVRRAVAESPLGSHVLDVVPGLASVLVTLDAGPTADPAPDLPEALDQLEALLIGIEPSPADGATGVTHRLAVVFDGADLEAVADHLGRPPDQLVAMVTGATLTVAVVGFSPGFAYLDGLPEALRRVPRRPVPRPRVPAGSLAVAAGFAAVYPQATPGGWQLLGRTAERLFDPGVAPFARLGPGDTVRVVSVDRWSEPPPEPVGIRAPLVPPPGWPEGFVVEHPGWWSSVQDGGRVGVAALGVPRAGPLDPAGQALANRLVGNHPGTAALEVSVEGPVLRCRRAGFVAVTGEVVVRLDGLAVPTGTVVPVAEGQTLALGRVLEGVRACLAVAGGLVVPLTLGSASTDGLSGLGPGRLVAGDRLGVGTQPDRALGDHCRAAEVGELVAGDGARLVRVVAGPHPEWFPEHALARLADRRFEVSATSDRVGLRLRAMTGSVDRHHGELEAQGMITGAVQVPPSGEPVVLLADHATLGGYPVVAVVITADLAVLGQCRAGDRLGFVPVDRPEAWRARAQQRRWLAGAVIGHYPVEAG